MGGGVNYHPLFVIGQDDTNRLPENPTSFVACGEGLIRLLDVLESILKRTKIVYQDKKVCEEDLEIAGKKALAIDVQI